MVIGLGMGQSKLDASVQVYQVVDGSRTQILDFNTHADSGSMPGAAIMGAPGAAVGGATMVASVGVNVAAAGVKNYTSATGIMAKWSADQAANFMSQYFAQQGWIGSRRSKGKARVSPELDARSRIQASFFGARTNADHIVS